MRFLCHDSCMCVSKQQHYFLLRHHFVGFQISILYIHSLSPSAVSLASLWLCPCFSNCSLWWISEERRLITLPLTVPAVLSSLFVFIQSSVSLPRVSSFFSFWHLSSLSVNYLSAVQYLTCGHIHVEHSLLATLLLWWSQSTPFSVVASVSLFPLIRYHPLPKRRGLRLLSCSSDILSVSLSSGKSWQTKQAEKRKSSFHHPFTLKRSSVLGSRVWSVWGKRKTLWTNGSRGRE